jgi:hypothetical protein
MKPTHKTIEIAVYYSDDNPVCNMGASCHFLHWPFDENPRCNHSDNWLKNDSCIAIPDNECPLHGDKIEFLNSTTKPK